MAYTISTGQLHEVGAAIQITTDHHDEVRPAEHPGLELNFDFTENLDMLIGGKPYQVHPGEMLVCNGRVPHVEIHRGSCETHKAILIRESATASLIGDERTARELLFENPVQRTNQKILGLANQIFALRSSKYLSPALVEFLCDDLTTEILARLMENKEFHLSREYYPMLVHRIKKRIYNDFRNPELSLSVLAQEFGMSKFHFLRVFKKTTGSTPIQYLNHLRIEDSKSALLSENHGVTDLAFASGFGGLSSFYESFQRKVGCAPLQFAATHLTPLNVVEKSYSFMLEPLSK